MESNEEQEYEQNESEDTSQSALGQAGNTAKRAAKKAAKETAKKAVKVAAKVIGKAILKLLGNPYVLGALAIILVAVIGYFVIKNSFPKSSVSSTQYTLEINASAENADEQTKAVAQTYEVNRSYLTATIKDINAIYSDFIASLEESDSTNALEDMKKEFGTDDVTLQEMNFEKDPLEYNKPVEERTAKSNTTTKTSSTSSVINSTAATNKYPTTATYVLPSQKRELYKHMLMTEKYNFNMINWKLYKAEGDGGNRYLPAEPTNDIQYAVEPSLGLRFPLSTDKTADYFVQLVEPYLQSSLIPISMYSMSINTTTNSSDDDGVYKNAEFAYAIISEAYSDITMNIYQLEEYTENWSKEYWDEAKGDLYGTVQCLRVPTNLDKLCEENITVTVDEVKEQYCDDKENEEDCPNWEKMISSGGAFQTSEQYKEYENKAKAVKCSEYKVDNLVYKGTNEITSKSDANKYYKTLTSNYNSDIVTYEYRNCAIVKTEGFILNEDTQTIISTNNESENRLTGSSKEVSYEYKPYRVKSFDIVLEYEYEFEVYNTNEQPDSITTSTVELDNEKIEENIIEDSSYYVQKASSIDCHDENDSCDGRFYTIIGDYKYKVNRKRVNTTKKWSDKLITVPNGFSHRRYNFDDVVEFVFGETLADATESFSTTAINYYSELESDKKINRIDLINANPEIFNNYITNLESFDKNISIKQSSLSYTYNILKERFKDIQVGGILPYIYGQTLGLNSNYLFDDEKDDSCSGDYYGLSGYGGYIWPLPNNPYISGLYGYTSWYGANHEGIDIWATETGEQKAVDVVAARDGTVYLASDAGIESNTTLGIGGYGNHIIIKHNDGKYTLYGHLETGTFKVKTGEIVKAGQVIAKTGSSGNSSAWHLHFNISNEPYSDCEDPLLYYIVEPTSSEYPEYSKAQKSQISTANAYKFVGVKSENGTAATLDNFLFIGDSRTEGISDRLKDLGENINVQAVSSSKQSEWIEVVKNGSGTVQGKTVTLPEADSVSGVSVALGVNEIDSTGKMDELLSELLTRYPNKIIYVNSVFPVAEKYTDTNASTLNSKIKKFNEHLKTKCSSNQNLVFVDVSENLVTSTGYLNSEYTDYKGLDLSNDRAKEKLVNNIQDGILSGGSFTSNSGGEITNEYSVASDMKKITNVSSGVDTDAFKKFKNKYWSYITKWSDAYELDPYLILAIGAHESGCGGVNLSETVDENFRKIRKSESKNGIPSTVTGIWQLTLWGETSYTNNTKDKNGNSIGTVDVDEQVLGNVEMQIRIACAMMRDNYDKQDNKTLPAILSYNKGPGNKISEETAKNYPYVQNVAIYYDIQNSGKYSGGFYECIKSDSSVENVSETINLEGSYVGEGKEEGDDYNNKGYFTNAGGTKYHTYNQSAYNDKRWTNNGCGPTCCAIVLSGLTGVEREPNTIFTLTGYTSFEKDLIPLLNKYNITTEQYYSGKQKYGHYEADTLINNTDKEFILKELEKGHPVIVYMKKGGSYNGCTYSGHFMTLLGVKSNGDVYVADPGGRLRDGWISIDTLVKYAQLTTYLICKPS